MVVTTLTVVATAAGQLPTATGRTFNLSTDPNGFHKLFIPDGYIHTGQNVDLLIHFHGDSQTVNNNAQYAGLNAVIVNVTYPGLSSAYQTPFSNPSLLGNITSAALTQLRAQSDFHDNTTWGNQAVSSFSAGYAAVREILKPTQSYYNQIKGILLADSLYASFTSTSDHTPLASQMVDFKRFALDASNGSKTFVFSHSQVPTFTYCRTDECADSLVPHVAAAWQAHTATGLGGMQFYRRSLKGNFAIYGAIGADGPAHSLHLQTMGQFLGALPLSRVPEPGSMLATLLVVATLARRRRRG
jgi:hypothetical protein